MPGNNDLSIQQLQQQVRDLLKEDKDGSARTTRLETKEEVNTERADKFEADIDGHEGRILKLENKLSAYERWAKWIAKCIVYVGGGVFAVVKWVWGN